MPSYWPWLAAALLWAAIIMLLYTFGVNVWPYDDWLLSDKLSLLQSAVAVAGFGAGSIALFVAVREFARTHAEPDVYIKLDAPIEITLSGSVATASTYRNLVILNLADVVIRNWQLRVRSLSTEKPSVSVELRDSGAVLVDGAVAWNNYEVPLFPVSPRPPIPILVSVSRGETLAGSHLIKEAIEVRMETEFGGVLYKFPLTVVIEEASETKESASTTGGSPELGGIRVKDF